MTDRTSTNPVHERDVTRRTFLARAIGACIAFLGAVLGIPAAGAAIGPAFRRTEAEWAQLGDAAGFPEETPTSVELGVTRRDGWIESTEMKSVWVVRHSADEFTVFNGRCTHLGCAYRWEPDKGQFLCPCHAGVFAKDGSVISGPPPRPLDPLPVRVEAGKLLVQYLDYRLGIVERVVS